MNNSIYYGTETTNTFTFMEFGEFDVLKSTKKTWGLKMHQKAYDWFMLSRYSNDLLAFNKLKEIMKGSSFESKFLDYHNQEIHHDDEMAIHLTQLIALYITQNNNNIKQSFYELGQTIFGCIEGIELYHALLKHYNLSNFEYNSNKITWYGVDISEMFNELSIMLHKDLDVKTSLDTSILPKVVDVFFSKGITLLYAIRDVNSLFKTINSGRLSIFDYSFSLKHNEDITIGSGKTVRYLFLNDFINELNNNNTKLFLVKKANSKFIEDHNRLWLDCVYGEIDLVKNFVKEEIKIRNNIYNQMSVYPNSNRFLNNENISEWVTIEDYINTLNK